MKIQQLVFVGSVCLHLVCLRSAALAVQIGPAAFGAGTVVESFEGLSPGPNIIANPDSGSGGFLVPGVTAPFSFGSGVTLTAPIPNANRFSRVLVGDFKLGPAPWGLGMNGDLTSARVVSGSAYLGNNNCCSEAAPLRLQFSSDMLRVGIYATDFDDRTITLTAFDALGAILESVSVGAVPVRSWGSNFLGVENSAGIRSITLFSVAGVPVYDDLMFEAVPEPSISVLVFIGAMMMIMCVSRTGVSRFSRL